MPAIKTIYQGQLRTTARHVASGSEITTDAPLDNQGLGLAFSPTDLLAAALGSCMLTIMGIAANTHNFNIDGTEVSITKIMAANPRRVSEIIVELTMPNCSFTAIQKNILKIAAVNCPVAKSLHPEIKQNINIIYP